MTPTPRAEGQKDKMIIAFISDGKRLRHCAHIAAILNLAPNYGLLPHGLVKESDLD
jgi:hypothetical protein